MARVVGIVGGPIMDHILIRLNLNGRISLCGMIADYNSYGHGEAHVKGQVNIDQLIMMRARIKGFLVQTTVKGGGLAVAQGCSTSRLAGRTWGSCWCEWRDNWP